MASENIAPEPTFDDYLKNEHVSWWPRWVAREYYHRKTLIWVTENYLTEMGKRGHFIAGVKNGAPSRLAPFDKLSFMNWVHGKGPKVKAPKKKRAAVGVTA